MLAPLLAIAAAAVMVSGCVVEGKQIRLETPVSASQTTPPQHPATVELWQSGPPLGWEVFSPGDAMKSHATFRSWIVSFKGNGANTLLLQRHLLGHRHESKIQWKDLVREAHRQRVRVYAVLNLREGLFDGDSHGWSDVHLNADSGALRPSRSPDLLHPEFQELIKSASLDLATAGVDLIVFRFDPPSGPFDGFSQHGLDGFRRDFNHRLSPRKLFTSGGRQWTQDSPGVMPVARVRGGFAPEFWRWVGWKNREYLNVLDGVMAAVRQQQPGARFGIELHTDTIVNPRRALVRYTEDFLESRRRLFDRFIVAVPESGEHGVVESSVGQAAIEMTELLDDPSMVFVLVSGRRPMWSTANEALNVKASLGLQRGVGLGFRGRHVP